jgi:hypothetical protein
LKPLGALSARRYREKVKRLRVVVLMHTAWAKLRV